MVPLLPKLIGKMCELSPLAASYQKRPYLSISEKSQPLQDLQSLDDPEIFAVEPFGLDFIESKEDSTPQKWPNHAKSSNF